MKIRGQPGLRRAKEPIFPSSQNHSKVTLPVRLWAFVNPSTGRGQDVPVSEVRLHSAHQMGVGRSLSPLCAGRDQTLKTSTVISPTFYNKPSHQSRKCGVLFRVISHPSSCRPLNGIMAPISRPPGLARREAPMPRRLVSDHTPPPVAASPCTFLSSETRLKMAETTSALAVYCCRTNCPTHGS